MTGAYTFSVDNPRQAELLSYLQGLAPVGEPFEFRRRHALADLGMGTTRSLYRNMDGLIRRGLVARCKYDLLPKRQGLVVLKRLEDMH